MSPFDQGFQFALGAICAGLVVLVAILIAICIAAGILETAKQNRARKARRK